MEEDKQIGRKNSTQIAGQIARSLIDEMMMARYGTSLEVGMTREYQKEIEAKYQKLKGEFDAINRDTNDTISFEELVEFFQKYSKEVKNDIII
jgi:transposase